MSSKIPWVGLRISSICGCPVNTLFPVSLFSRYFSRWLYFLSEVKDKASASFSTFDGLISLIASMVMGARLEVIAPYMSISLMRFIVSRSSVGIFSNLSHPISSPKILIRPTFGSYLNSSAKSEFPSQQALIFLEWKSPETSILATSYRRELRKPSMTADWSLSILNTISDDNLNVLITYDSVLSFGWSIGLNDEIPRR